MGLYGFFIEPYSVSVSRIDIPLPPGWEMLKGKTAVHLSDLHIKEIGRREKKILKIIDEVDPDYIFLTGDYVSWEGDYPPALTFLSKLKAKKGTWAVMGDYDYSDSRRSCLFCHVEGTGEKTRSHPVNFIRNTFLKTSLKGRVLTIGGADPGGYGWEEFSKLLPSMRSKGPLLLLSHSPLAFDNIPENTTVLVLSGDTHGGQVIMPGWIYRITGYEKNLRYNQGFFEEGKKMMYVSRGVGTSHLPFRFLRTPEVVVLHFVSNRVKKNE